VQTKAVDSPIGNGSQEVVQTEGVDSPISNDSADLAASPDETPSEDVGGLRKLLQTAWNWLPSWPRRSVDWLLQTVWSWVPPCPLRLIWPGSIGSREDVQTKDPYQGPKSQDEREDHPPNATEQVSSSDAPRSEGKRDLAPVASTSTTASPSSDVNATSAARAPSPADDVIAAFLEGEQVDASPAPSTNSLDDSFVVEADTAYGQQQPAEGHQEKEQEETQDDDEEGANERETEEKHNKEYEEDSKADKVTEEEFREDGQSCLIEQATSFWSILKWAPVLAGCCAGFAIGYSVWTGTRQSRLEDFETNHIPAEGSDQNSKENSARSEQVEEDSDQNSEENSAMSEQVEEEEEEDSDQTSKENSARSEQVKEELDFEHQGHETTKEECRSHIRTKQEARELPDAIDLATMRSQRAQDAPQPSTSTSEDQDSSDTGSDWELC